ncbi:hypothetical protein FRACA_80063 [Frankia canadensis]|uniref:Uncharacterized protein n=1 Tax=Frankia canadensis TaxID=1836972 RepID=A0A2I2L1G1_9ACTN|nr:hypothetical protein FRACA_80063 [Frankia canadensis]SOU59053.1 hypothetical protein FRACA_80063 [Frankia canadensis]
MRVVPAVGSMASQAVPLTPSSPDGRVFSRTNVDDRAPGIRSAGVADGSSIVALMAGPVAPAPAPVPVVPVIAVIDALGVAGAAGDAAAPVTSFPQPAASAPTSTRPAATPTRRNRRLRPRTMKIFS